MKTVTFANDEPIVQKIPAMAEEEYPLTFYLKEEIEQFRHEAVLEMMGVPLSPPAAAVSPMLHMRRKRLSGESNVKSDAEVLAALAASPLFQAAQAEEAAKLADMGKGSSRPSLGDRQPSIRERRSSDDRRRPRPSATGHEKSIVSSDSGDQAVPPPGRQRRQQRPSAGDSRPTRSGGRLVRDSVTRDRSVISALPPAPPVS
mmetsp:Transcript_83837/g.125672  ORF Transcript_83837/g.125672 Transcript_83837/m.125672 type:complete len:202 (-) Transcript_83837:114-719(-)